MRLPPPVRAPLAGALAAGLALPLTAATPAAAGPAAPARPAAVAASATVTGTVATGLASPWGLAILPDGSAVVSSRDEGTVWRVPRGGGEPRRVGSVPGSVHSGEGGLLGLALHPGYPRQPWLYAYTTTASDNRIVRMRFDGSSLGATQVVLRGIGKAGNHNGGRIAFGPDGMLYAGTGDAGAPSRSQNRSSLNGKILRMTPTGGVPAGNPFRGSLVWSLGHRNVQGLAWDSRGRMWASEFGQNTWDELNRIVKGKNYGWPRVEGRAGRRGFVDPVAQWSPAVASPSGITVAAGAVWVASLRGQRLWRVPVGGGTPRAYFAGTYGRLRAVAVAPGGRLFLMTNNTDGRIAPRSGDDRLLRVKVT
ncbi:PQQ-dependent sugar dehydrogenase [Motilibacter aurantiacus]|uniref:PQQ-dependent sugar dehydrogenase n=1 Tax=Motilibacter aurantiacus TaxID=2714955 RepID=UPI00140796A9|nr:PQQ-dependent sugar dehydrogenase [Motilibacter aurantiacus]NHC44695.1 PQQ-dependent sugar dehydrogenase [Motilibacter aurantiacus]